NLKAKKKHNAPDKTIEEKRQIMILATKSYQNGQQDSTKIEKEIPNNDTKAKELPPITKKEVPNKTPND
ncbi:40485_t:CDS:1, partial [Gigaspora margarita]